MRILFIGAVEFSRCVLEHLLENNINVVGVCTLRESNFNTDHVDLSTMSAGFAVPWIYADDINSVETLNWIKTRTPDVIFCFGWSKLLKKEILALAPLGVVGFHPSALPANRGRHPLIWALVLGLDKTASTFFFMNDGADNGDIISQSEIIIDEQDDARSLYNKVIKIALVQIDEFLPNLNGNSRQKQNDQLANSWRKRGPADGKIDWRMSAQSIHNLVRGLSKPYAGASFSIDGKDIKVWKATVVRTTQKNVEPGKIIYYSKSGPVVKCGEDAICLIITEPYIVLTVGSYL